MADLHMNWSMLLSIARSPGEPIHSDEPADLLPPVYNGIACLMAVYLSRRTQDAARRDEPLTFSDHDHLTTAIIGDPAVAINLWIPYLVLDAIQRTGWAAVPHFGFSADVSEDESFDKYLKKISHPAVATTTSSVGYNAYLLSTYVLQSHPSSRARLAFIRDSMPVNIGYETKALAVRWLREEYVLLVKSGFEDECASNSVFAKPQTLETMAARVFMADGIIPFSSLQCDMEFFNAGLNFLYLLCASRPLRQQLEVARVIQEADVETKYLIPLEKTVHHEFEVLKRDYPDMDRSYLSVLEFNISRAREGLKMLSE